MFWNEFRIIKSQNVGSLLMKSSQSNFNLQSSRSYLARSYLIATVELISSNIISKTFILHKNSNTYQDYYVITS